MLPDEKTKTRFSGGVGYISIMLIFTVICLTIFAVLSFQAAYSGNRVIGRSEEYSAQYYSADASAKKALSELDLLAEELRGGFSFDEEFSAAASGISGGFEVTALNVPEGVRTDYSVKINERQSLSVSVVFYRTVLNERYRILSWRSVSSGSVSGDDHPAVWDGEDIIGKQ